MTRNPDGTLLLYYFNLKASFTLHHVSGRFSLYKVRVLTLKSIAHVQPIRTHKYI